MTLFDVHDEPGDLLSTDGLRRLLTVRGVGSQSALRIARRYVTSAALSEANPGDLTRLVPRAEQATIDRLLDLPERADLPPDVRAISAFDTEWAASPGTGT